MLFACWREEFEEAKYNKQEGMHPFAEADLPVSVGQGATWHAQLHRHDVHQARGILGKNRGTAYAKHKLG